MRGELKRKTTRTVHGQKIIRLRIDIPIAEVENAGSETQDIPRWLDKRVGGGINFQLSGILDDDQVELEGSFGSGKGEGAINTDDGAEILD